MAIPYIHRDREPSKECGEVLFPYKDYSMNRDYELLVVRERPLATYHTFILGKVLSWESERDDSGRIISFVIPIEPVERQPLETQVRRDLGLSPKEKVSFPFSFGE
ncbi:hypothetical protein HYU50_00775 [Candidatus Woesearchaeota archaeon]|nr:hypothetical protein [Candidatus Woesearchaeota archaeon]